MSYVVCVCMGVKVEREWERERVRLLFQSSNLLIYDVNSGLCLWLRDPSFTRFYIHWSYSNILSWKLTLLIQTDIDFWWCIPHILWANPDTPISVRRMNKVSFTLVCFYSVSFSLICFQSCMHPLIVFECMGAEWHSSNFMASRQQVDSHSSSEHSRTLSVCFHLPPITSHPPAPIHFISTPPSLFDYSVNREENTPFLVSRCCRSHQPRCFFWTLATTRFLLVDATCCTWCA